MKVNMYKIVAGSFLLLLGNIFAQSDITNLPGTISAQYTDSPTGEGIAKVIDNQSSTKYLTFHATGWIQFRSNELYVVNRYTITSANDADARDPKSWTLQGSANGTTWTTLDSRANEDFPTRFLKRSFTFTNSIAYSYYRLQLTNNSGSILQLAEMELFGVPVAAGVATVYKHCNYSTSGYAVALPVGNYTTAQLVARGISDNDISSIKVSAGYEVVLFYQDNFTGTTFTVKADNKCLVENSFNDQTSSLRVQPASTAIATFYELCDYSPSGYAISLPVGSYTTAQLVARGIPDNDISSIKVSAGYEVVLYFDDNLVGTSFTVTADNKCLTENFLNNQVSSLRVQATVVNQAPSVSITAPANNASFTAPANISITASASDVDGTVTKVEFYSGTTKLGEDATSPYTFNWSNVAAGAYSLVAIATDNGGRGKASTTVNVTVTTVTNGGWENFQYPQILFEDKSPSHPGSTIFHNAIPDPQGAMREQILILVKKLHYNAADNIQSFTKLHFIIEDYDGVAEKWGGSPEIWIRVSTRHIQNVYNDFGGNPAAVRTEILGILSHEGTHGYQYEPRNAGEYDGNSDFYGFIEGLADYVRISVGLHPGRVASTGGSWRHGYTTSGFFIKWMVDKKDPNFAIKFNHTARTYPTWSWDLACQNILGVGVQSLWNEYQAWISAGQPGVPSLKTADVANNDMEKYTCKYDGQSVDVAHAHGEEIFTYQDGNMLNVLCHDKISSVEIISLGTGLGSKSVQTGKAAIVDVSGLASGLHVVQVQTESGEVIQKRIVIAK